VHSWGALALAVAIAGVIATELATIHASEANFRWWWPTNWVAVPAIIFVTGLILLAVPLRRSIPERAQSVPESPVQNWREISGNRHPEPARIDGSGLSSDDLVAVLSKGHLPTVNDLDPYRLGATVSAYGGPDTYQKRDVYVLRAVDERLAAELHPGRLVILVGPSKVGKTRTAFEVLRRHEDWGSALLVAPVPQSLGVLLNHPALRGDGRLVLWLDEVQRFLPPSGSLSQAAISRLMTRPGPTLLLGTLRAEQRSLLRGPAGDMAREVRIVLDSASIVELASTVDDPDERARASAAYQNVNFRGAGLAEMLAGAPVLLDSYHDSAAADPVVHALVQACIDWTRCGVPRPVPQSDLFFLARAALEEARPDQEMTDAEEMSQALFRARSDVAPGGKVALLRAHRSGAEEPGYEPFDYLVAADDGQDGRQPRPIPELTWRHVLDRAADQEAASIGAAAHQRGNLEVAVTAFLKAAESPSADGKSRAAALSGLVTTLRTRYEKVGAPSDLEDAILAAGECTRILPERDPDWPLYAANLGSALLARFLLAGQFADLDQAVTAAWRAVAAARTADHLSQAPFEFNLASALLVRFEATGAITDLNEAIRFAERAVAATSADHPDQSAFLAGLQDVIRATTATVSNTPLESTDRLVMLSNLANALVLRFQRTGAQEDLDEAIGAARQAVSAAPADHRSRALFLSNLANALQVRFQRTGAQEDLDEAISAARSAAEGTAGSPLARLDAAKIWADAAADVGRMSEAADAYATAISLLPVVAWHGLDRGTQEYHLAKFPTLVADAAACTILSGQPERAIELLEQSRSLLWTQALTLRSDLADLAARAPHIAERLGSIRTLLNAPLPETGVPQTDTDEADGTQSTDARAADQRLHLALEWDQLLTQARAIPGFEHFLAPIPYQQLTAAASDGPVIILNASRYGSHAIILQPDTSLTVLDLPDATPEAVVKHVSQQGIFRYEPTGRDNRLLETLAWTWDIIAEPALRALSYAKPPEPGAPWPRVWWCPIGILEALPIHAAGRHRTHESNKDNDSVIGRVISSYTPTLTALIRARVPLSMEQRRQLTICVAGSPEMPPLPGADSEARMIARIFPPGESNHQLFDASATRTAVMDALETHSWMHFAGHAFQDAVNPQRSGLLLWDGLLTTYDLATAPTQPRELAFLSSNETARGGVQLPDENLHLAAAMQFIGYRHVIATVGLVDDTMAAEVSRYFYEYLMQEGEGKADNAAIALHHAVRALMKSNQWLFTILMSYVHLGA
jgi:tetratricopeptide (TPR) repeat protein